MVGWHGPGDVRFFDRVARLYDLLAPPLSHPSVTAGLAHAERSVDRVLDLGGGTGRVVRALDADAVVVDPSRGMLRQARNYGLPCVRADGRSLPVCEGSVDAVVVVDALHHMPNPRLVLQEVVRALAPGGVVVIREFNPDTLTGRALAGLERAVGFDSVFTPPGDMARFVGECGLDARLVDGGFGYTVVGLAERRS